jgi:prepilin-type N-terminal cleavage/methylation domain-containing protein
MKKKQYTADQGFTLIEILVVLVLMTLILGISGAFFANSLAGARQKAAAREIVATLRYAKHLAGATHEQQVLQFDLDSGNYGIQGRRIREIPEKTKLTIYEAGLNTDPVVKGGYQIRFGSNEPGQWDKITLSRGERIIRIQADPVLTAVIAGAQSD